MQVGYRITGTAWKAISSAGQFGTVWVQDLEDNGKIIICHSSTGVGGLDKSLGFPVYVPTPTNGPLNLKNDSLLDIFYARCRMPYDTAFLVADFTL